MTDLSCRRNSLLEASEFEVSGRNAIMDARRTKWPETPRGPSPSDGKESHLPTEVPLGGLTASRESATLRPTVEPGEAGVHQQREPTDRLGRLQSGESEDFLSGEEVPSTRVRSRSVTGVFLWSRAPPIPRPSKPRIEPSHQRRFAPITMPDPSGHDAPIRLVTMAEMRRMPPHNWRNAGRHGARPL
jgi:hypothetical protein